MKLEVVFGFLLVITSSSANLDNDNFLSIENRIVGGIQAPNGMFPFMVPLWAERTSDQGLKYGTFCGSSLISEEYILTASHCVIGDNIDRIKLFFGTDSINQDPENGRTEMIVPKENIIMHEEYNKNVRLRNDIALVKLPRKINFDHNIKPVRLPRRSQPDIESDVAIILGWGSRGKDVEHSDLLHYAQLWILPNEKCYNHFRIYYDGATHMCIDGTEKSACHGDSGGAAVIVDREDRKFTQVGIASYVSPQGCEKGYPFAYTRVTAFLDWIHQHTGIPIQD